MNEMHLALLAVTHTRARCLADGKRVAVHQGGALGLAAEGARFGERTNRWRAFGALATAPARNWSTRL